MTEFTVASFNMQFGMTWDPKNPDKAPIDLTQTIEQIKSLEADIVLLQEVEQVIPAVGQVQPPPNYLRLYEAFPSLHSYFSYPPADAKELPFGYGLAVFSRFPLEEPEAIALPAPDLTFSFEGKTTHPTDRLLIGVKLEISGQRIQVYNTHLQAFFIINYSSDNFPEQRNTVAAKLLQSKLPTIIGGDFNSAPGESTIEVIEGLGYRSVQKTAITWKRRPYILDHLLYSPHLAVKQHWVIDTDAADHKILMAQFEL